MYKLFMAFRYLLESLTEEELLRIDGETPLGNCSRTHYRPTDHGRLELVSYGDVDHLEASEAEPTHEQSRAHADDAAQDERSA